MKKILYTTCYDDIIESISNICNCPKDNIERYLEQSLLFEDISLIKEIDLDKFFKNIGIKFNGKNELYEIVKFDSCVISHLTSRINKPDNSEIYYLSKSLLCKTDISKFLEDNGLIFRKYGQKLDLYYNEKLIDWDNFDNSIIGRIKARLSINGKYTDNCINGFLFNDNFWMDINVEHIMKCPEIIEDICTVLERYDIIREWNRRSKPYALGFLVDVKDIVLDNHSNFHTEKSKIYLIYKYVIYYLVQKYHGKWKPQDGNVIIRLKEKQCVSKESIIGFYEIKDS